MKKETTPSLLLKSTLNFNSIICKDSYTMMCNKLDYEVDTGMCRVIMERGYVIEPTDKNMFCTDSNAGRGMMKLCFISLE